MTLKEVNNITTLNRIGQRLQENALEGGNVMVRGSDFFS